MIFWEIHFRSLAENNMSGSIPLSYLYSNYEATASSRLAISNHFLAGRIDFFLCVQTEREVNFRGGAIACKVNESTQEDTAFPGATWIDAKTCLLELLLELKMFNLHIS